MTAHYGLFANERGVRNAGPIRGRHESGGPLSRRRRGGCRRSGGWGPTFVEARTDRLARPHVRSHQSYQPPTSWLRPALPRRYRLSGIVRSVEGSSTTRRSAAIQTGIDQEVETAMEFASASVLPSAYELLVDVFSDKKEVPA